jgi:hypothetical protein
MDQCPSWELIAAELIKKFCAHKEPEGSVLYSQELATGLCSEPIESIPHPHIFYETHFNIIIYGKLILQWTLKKYGYIYGCSNSIFQM